MRRWQVTAILVVLAGAGVSLVAGMPVGAAMIGAGRTVVQTAYEWAVPTWKDDVRIDPVPLPVPVEPTPVAPTTIPELSEPIRPAPPVITVLPPDPVPVHYGCGGRPVPLDQPVPACGMG